MSSCYASTTVNGDIGALEGLLVDIESNFGGEGQKETELEGCWYIR